MGHQAKVIIRLSLCFSLSPSLSLPLPLLSLAHLLTLSPPLLSLAPLLSLSLFSLSHLCSPLNALHSLLVQKFWRGGGRHLCFFFEVPHCFQHGMEGGGGGGGKRGGIKDHTPTYEKLMEGGGKRGGIKDHTPPREILIILID